jgi:ELWxxDGT repeat protein
MARPPAPCWSRTSTRARLAPFLPCLTNVNGTLFFQADDGTSGYELWKSDGTSTGTVLVKDIRPGPSSSFPFGLTNVNGTLFFHANDGTNGDELWKSDGTSTGTVLVKDIRPGPSDSFPSGLTNVNGTLFFEANDGTSGYELWKSDGTSTGTVLVNDIFSGPASSNPYLLTNVNGTLFFRANDGTNGVELWATDEWPPTITSVTGPTAGTYIVGQHLDFTVVFSEAVVVTGTPRLQLTIGSATRYATYLSGSGTSTLVFSYPVQSGDLDTDGIAVASSIGLNGGTITDVPGNDAVLTFTPPDTSGVLVDGVAPTVVQVIPPANGTYKAGQVLDVLVKFSEPVVVGTSGSATPSTPYVRLRIGSVIRNALFHSQPNAVTLRFRYTVQTGDLDTNGIEILSPVIRPTGTFIRDANGNNASTTFTNPSTPGVKVDAVAPTIVLVTPPANGHYVTGQVLDILVKFSEPVNVGTTSTAKPFIRLRIGSVIRNAVFHSKPNAVTLRFRYVIQSSDHDTNGIEILSPIMRPTGTFIRDLAGNDAIVTFVPPNTSGVLVN